MATKTFKGRIQNKHDTEANWSVAVNFKPLAGELIIYDVDAAHLAPRFKVGDGSTLVSDLPFVSAKVDTSNFAKLNGDNNFTGHNTYEVSADKPDTIVYKNDTSCFTEFGGRWVRVTDTMLDGVKNVTSYRGDGLLKKTTDGSGDTTNTLIKWPTKTESGLIFATTSDIDITAAGNNIFTGTNTFKTEISGSLYRTLIDQNGISVGGGPATSGILIDVTYGLDNIKRLYSGTTYTYTFPNKNGMFATMDDIPAVASLAKLAQDNTFTGNNTFTGDFSRKTQDSSGVIYYKESISDQGFTVGVGATEAATGTQAIYGYGSIKVTAGAAGTGTLSLPVKTGTLALTSDISAVKTGFFPVGYIYITTSSASPAGIFGGTWEQIKDKFLLAAGDTYTAGSTGGSADAVVVEHRHLQSVSPASGTDSGVSTWEATTLYNGGNKITAYTSYEGVNGAGKNLPPYLVVHVWKRIA